MRKLLLLLISSCNSNNEVITKYKSGKIKSRVNIDSFGNFQGYRKEFYENGHLKNYRVTNLSRHIH